MNCRWILDITHYFVVSESLQQYPGTVGSEQYDCDQSEKGVACAISVSLARRFCTTKLKTMSNKLGLERDGWNVPVWIVQRRTLYCIVKISEG